MIFLATQNTGLATQIAGILTIAIPVILTQIGIFLKKNKSKKAEKKVTETARDGLILQLNDISARVDIINEKVESQSEPIAKLLEMHKSDEDIRLLEVKLNTLVEVERDVSNELQLAVSNGINEAIKIFTFVFVNNFNVKIETIETKIKLAQNKISKLCICENIETQNGKDFKTELKSEIKFLFDSYIIDLPEIFKKENGKRRSAFSFSSFELVKNITLKTEQIFNKYK